LTLATVLACLGGRPAGATLDNLKSYKAAYPGKDTKAYSCKVRHQSLVAV